ncbi:sensor histidine kinase [Marispirochaeta sp.]|jgi:two-component system, sensor histidine kinase YesM|uniref:cache domain-containing sensor histidine kinase n=1 Tax=Marispirochaeta sp. TaxID=2038653 RepID=UPI0029C8AE92|nr:sensor histidine kinase [Marispirochaeta sp.]
MTLHNQSRFFLRNFALFLVPLFVSLMLLGSISIAITQKFVRDEIDRKDTILLGQIMAAIEVMLNEMDSLNLNFGTNPEINFGLKRILRNDPHSLSNTEIDKLAMIRNFIDAPANSRPYIYSIYVYLNNDHGRFLATTEGLTSVDSFFDTQWYVRFQTREPGSLMWTEVRDVRQYAFERESKKILSIYRRLFSSGIGRSDGVIVLNINADYIENLLSSLRIYPEQRILITDRDGNIMFGSPPEGFSITETPAASNGRYSVSYRMSKRYGWQYISVVPSDIIYDIPSRLSLITFGVFIFSALMGLAITYVLTRRNYRNIQNIISIIDSAENDQPLPSGPSGVHDEYGYIVQNLLKTFIERSYLKVQLSERMYRTRTIELLALQSQMNPHFLFNTLETINWKVMGFTGNPNEANEMITSLSDVLQYSLRGDQREVSLEEEIENTRSYIAIQKVRYRDKFEVVWDCNDELLECGVMKLLLQPLVENSIYHGIKTMKGSASIHITVRSAGEAMEILVKDTGSGIPREILKNILESLTEEREEKDLASHIGLYNTNKRLKLLYGDEYGLQIHSVHGEGTTVIATLPLNPL